MKYIAFSDTTVCSHVEKQRNLGSVGCTTFSEESSYFIWNCVLKLLIGSPIKTVKHDRLHLLYIWREIVMCEITHATALDTTVRTHNMQRNCCPTTCSQTFIFYRHLKGGKNKANGEGVPWRLLFLKILRFCISRTNATSTTPVRNYDLP